MGLLNQTVSEILAKIKAQMERNRHATGKQPHDHRFWQQQTALPINHEKALTFLLEIN